MKNNNEIIIVDDLNQPQVNFQSTFSYIKVFSNGKITTSSRRKQKTNETPKKNPKHKKKEFRVKYGYDSNNAASLSLDIDNESLNNLEDNYKKLFEASRQNILHHAAMRVDLFFYTLIAYYNPKNYRELIKPGKILLQFGKGRDIAGCDLLLMSQGNDDEVDKEILQEAQKKKTPILIQKQCDLVIYGDPKGNGTWKFTKIAPPHTQFDGLPFGEKLMLLHRNDSQFTHRLIDTLKKGHLHIAKNMTQACHSSFFGAIQDKDSLLDKTHFLNNLNSTVELPGFVNEFDSILEERLDLEYDAQKNQKVHKNAYVITCRKKTMDIINEVAQGKYGPIEGLNKFFMLLETAFSQFKQAFKDNPNFKRWATFKALPADVREDFLTLVESGTFDNKWNAEHKDVFDKYIEMMLRLSSHEKAECLKSKAKRSECYFKKIEQIHKEIINNKLTQQAFITRKTINAASTLTSISPKI